MAEKEKISPVPDWLRLYLAERYKTYRRFSQDPGGWPSELITEQELLSFVLDDFEASLEPLRSGELVLRPTK